MAGLLDPKTRVLDTIITDEGRRQILNGGMRIKFATFSDSATEYNSDRENTFVSSSIKVNLESFFSRNDQITMITGDSGEIVSSLIGSDGEKLSSAESIASSSIDFLKNQMIISTIDSTRKDEGLSLTTKNITFSIIDGSPFDGEPSITSITDADSFFADKRLKRSSNFMYLPPIQKNQDIVSSFVELGKYTDFSEDDDVESDFFIEYLSELEMSEIEFSRLTEYNDIAIQFFESSSQGLKKLDIIKYGKIGVSRESSQSDLYFIGKIYFDEFDVPTFINIFTMVLE